MKCDNGRAETHTFAAQQSGRGGVQASSINVYFTPSLKGGNKNKV